MSHPVPKEVTQAFILLQSTIKLAILLDQDADLPLFSVVLREKVDLDRRLQANN
jgi:hypothetical protein